MLWHRSWFASKMMLGDGHKKANLELDKAILYVTDEMNATETAGVNFAAYWKQDKPLSAEAVYQRCRDFLAANPNVKGVAIGFEPGIYQATRMDLPHNLMKEKNGQAHREKPSRHLCLQPERLVPQDQGEGKGPLDRPI